MEDVNDTSIKCPKCDGGTSRGIACGQRDSGERFSKWIEHACSYCGGTGFIDEETWDRYLEGQTLRANRIARGLSGREEAKRLGIDARELNDIENGKVYEP